MEWKRELKEILKRNNMSDKHIEETVEYTDDDPRRFDEPIIGRVVPDLEEGHKIDTDVPSCWSNLKNEELLELIKLYYIWFYELLLKN